MDILSHVLLIIFKVENTNIVTIIVEWLQPILLRKKEKFHGHNSIQADHIGSNRKGNL